MRASRWLLLAALLLPAACDDPSGPGNGDPDPEPEGPIELVTIGWGPVTERHTAEVAARGNHAYTTTWGSFRQAPGNAILVWDVSSATPVLVDSLIVPEATTIGDVQISDDGSLLVVPTERVGGSIVIFDRSDPARPVRIARHHSANTNAGVHTVKLGRVNGTLFAFLAVNLSSEPSRLVVVDLSVPASPVEVLARPMGGPNLHDTFVRDGLLFTALWHDGVTIWDIGGGALGGSPADPVQIGNIRTKPAVGAPAGAGSSAHNVWWFHDPDTGSRRYMFVGEERPGVTGSASQGDIHVVDISDPANPVEVAFYNLPGAGTHNFWMDEAAGVLYAAYYNGGVRALDVTGDLSDCTAEERHTDGRCSLALMGREVGYGLTDRNVFVWGVQGVGNALFVSDMLSGLFRLDISELR